MRAVGFVQWLAGRPPREIDVNNAAVAAVLLQLGASEDEVTASWDVMKTWAVPETPQGVIDDCRRALQTVYDSYPRCGAGESEVYDHHCTLHRGHEGWHQDWRDDKLWAEWRETWAAPDTPPS